MIRLTDILNASSEMCGVEIEAIKGKSRRANIVRARHLYCYLAKSKTTHSLKKIAGEVGRSDHTTVINALGKIKRLLKGGDPEVTSLVAKISERAIVMEAARNIDRRFSTYVILRSKVRSIGNERAQA